MIGDSNNSKNIWNYQIQSFKLFKLEHEPSISGQYFPFQIIQLK